MSYTSEVLADSPFGFWLLNEASGTTFADSSGNGRPLNITAGSPALGVAGPTTTLNSAAAFPDNGGTAQTAALSWSTSPATVECWFKVDAIDPSGTWLVGGSTSGSNDKHLYLDGSGYLTWYVYSGGAKYTKSAAPVSVGAWHHVVASVGPAGTRVRLDKVTVGSNAAYTSSFNGSGQNFTVHNGAESGNIPFMSGAVTIAAVAAYPAQLSNARTDAHFDAAYQGPTLSLAGTAPSVAGAFDITATTPPPAIDLAGTAPAVSGAFGASVAVPPVSADLAGTAPGVTGAFGLTQSGVAFVDLAGNAPGVFGSFGVTASGPPIEVATDSVDRGNGMTLVTEWVVEVTPPITEPKRKRGHDYATATSISSPTFVDGRPT